MRNVYSIIETACDELTRNYIIHCVYWKQYFWHMCKNSQIKRNNATGSDLLRGSSNNTAREISSAGCFRTLKLDTINFTLIFRIFAF
jgi:hypothetical protein